VYDFVGYWHEINKTDAEWGRPICFFSKTQMQRRVAKRQLDKEKWQNMLKQLQLKECLLGSVTVYRT